MSESNPVIRRVAVTDSEWTPVAAPCGCNYFGVMGSAEGTPLNRCSDPENVASWYQMGGNYSLVAPRMGERRYEPGDIVTYLKSTSGPATAIVEFVL